MVESQPTWLSAEDEGGPSKLYYKFQALCARAVVVKRADSGVLLCVPRAGIPMRFFEEAATHNYPGDIGPYTEATLPAAVGSRQNERLLEAVIFEFVSRQTCRVRRGGLRYLRKISEECGLAGSSSYGRGCKQFCRPGRRS